MSHTAHSTSSTPMNWPVLCVIGCFLYLLGTTFYNIFLHPFAQYPGPLLAKISKAWSRYGNLQGRKSHRIHAAHQQYGPIVRVAPNELSFADPGAVRDIYANDALVKEEAFYRAKRVFHEEMLMSFRNPEAHRQRKKLLQRGFSQASMLAFEPEIDVKIQTLMKQWAESVRKDDQRRVDVYPWLLWLAFDIVYHLMFDEDPGSVKKGEAHWIMGYMRAWRPTFIYKEFIPQLEKWGVYVPGNVGGYFRSVQKWKNFASGLVQSCRTRDTKTPFLQTALNGTDSFLGRPLTNSELAEESMGGMFGGSGTTANTFAYLLWAALRRPEVTKRLREEVSDAFSDHLGAIPDAATCAKLSYLQAVINETLRLYPTIIATLPRFAIRDTVVAGVPIPAGTVVGTQNYTIHRNDKAFEHSNQFIPDRWLASEKDELMKEAFIPFSVGARSCIGINLARMELSKLTAAFFLRFDAKIDPIMTEASMELYDVFSASPAGGRLILRLTELSPEKSG